MSWGEGKVLTLTRWEQILDKDKKDLEKLCHTSKSRGIKISSIPSPHPTMEEIICNDPYLNHRDFFEYLKQKKPVYYDIIMRLFRGESIKEIGETGCHSRSYIFMVKYICKNIYHQYFRNKEE